MSISKKPAATTTSSRLSFPWQLHQMLEDSERLGFANIVSWLPAGDAFIVHQHDAFVERVMPKYFKQTKYKSFSRQLHIYGFKWAGKGPDKGSYRHPNFIKSDVSLCLDIFRKKAKKSSHSTEILEDFDGDIKKRIPDVTPVETSIAGASNSEFSEIRRSDEPRAPPSSSFGSFGFQRDSAMMLHPSARVNEMNPTPGYSPLHAESLYQSDAHSPHGRTFGVFDFDAPTTVSAASVNASIAPSIDATSEDDRNCVCASTFQVPSSSGNFSGACERFAAAAAATVHSQSVAGGASPYQIQGLAFCDQNFQSNDNNEKDSAEAKLTTGTRGSTDGSMEPRTIQDMVASPASLYARRGCDRKGR